MPASIHHTSEPLLPRTERIGGPRSLPAPRSFGTDFRYRNLETLGEGGMGTVFDAWDPVEQRTVALKFFHCPETDPAEEARLQGRVGRPWVPAAYESGTYRDRPYFAMERVAGEPLLKMRSRMGLSDKLEVFQAICESVEAIHRSGIVHCDLNPRNLLIERRGSQWYARVIDFGIALAEAPRVARPIIGSASFMAPEQALGEIDDIDPRTDIYALGATLYATLAGRQPFRAESSAAILSKALIEEPPPLGEIHPHLPEDLVAVVERAMSKEPADRFASAKAMANALADNHCAVH
ncbi:MAG: serine/threonine-protein kinase [Acidobacteriota bacterium]